MKRIVVREHGAPGVMKLEEVELGHPGPNEIKVRNHAIGVNYTDVYTRQGNETYLSKKNEEIEPFTPGKEGAGIVLEIGESVKRFKPGDRVVYVQSFGAYGEYHIVKESRTLPLPESLSFEIAASNTLRGLTAHFLMHYTYPVRKGEIVLVHAATGGVGSILTQWIKSKGATVIGTVDSDDKKETARQLGADFVINTLTEDVAAKVSEYTDGKKCHVVFDGLGKAVAEASLNSLRRFGYYVNYGMVTGSIHLDLWDLAVYGSLYATFGDLKHHEDDYDKLSSMAKDYFTAITDGTIHIEPPVQLSLAEAPKAHELLESNKRIATVILIP